MLQKFVSKLSKQEKMVFYITLGVVLVALLDRLFLGPVLAKLKAIDAETAQQKISIEGDLKILSYKNKILQKNKVFSKYFLKDVPDDDVVNAEFLSKVERLATQSKVSLVKSNPSEKRKYKEYVEYYANLDCTGDLKDIITFMHLINSTEDLLKVNKFNMAPKRGTPNEVNVSMTIVKLMMTVKTEDKGNKK
ncbi:hypothetical protein MNBD_UNCLBAC01-24 [hydrothermal vent metagenome]|uniref:General secretion pathway protein M n=1 Tax=hydrothermal vent metagenome TaxID=652676 RepID=A0A3B1D922_9ZZZZ